MPWWVPAAIGAAQLGGTIIRSIDSGGPEIDAERVRAAGGSGVNPFAGPAAQAGAGAAGRIIGAGPASPYEDAMARQEAMRQQQQRSLAGMRQYAMGDRSLARDQMAREGARLRQAMTGAAASARGRYGLLGGQRAAPVQSSLIGARMVAPTQAMMADEQNRAMEQYRQALAMQGRQEDASLMQEVQRQRAEREGLLYGEERQQYGAGQDVTAKGQSGGYALAQEMYKD
jgi:hypothetical protein